MGFTLGVRIYLPYTEKLVARLLSSEKLKEEKKSILLIGLLCITVIVRIQEKWKVNYK